MGKKLSILLLLFILSLVKLDRFFLKENLGFCQHYIQAPLTRNPAWDNNNAPPFELLSQPYHYLGKGSQTFVFESADGNYVLKFYRFPSHMRTVSWLKHPFAYHYDPKRMEIRKYNEEKFQLSFNSYNKAYRELPQETGVVYVHLNPTTNLCKTVTLIDHLKARCRIRLDQTAFVLQKKVDKFFTALEHAPTPESAQAMIDSLIQLIAQRAKKGISDLDAMHHDNYGYLNGKAIHLDIGRFIDDPAIKTEGGRHKEIMRVTAPLADYLTKKSPQLLEHYHECVKRAATSSSDV